MPLEPEPPSPSSTSADPPRRAARLGGRPNPRWEKVVRVRRALSGGAYAVEVALEAILEPLAAELGLACRDEEAADQA